MTLPSPELIVRAADEKDYRTLSNFLHYETRVHRHLDWRAPLEWLGAQPFLLAYSGRHLQGVLACPPDPPGIAWVRLFGVVSGAPVMPVWLRLFNAARDELIGNSARRFASISFYDWFEQTLRQAGFRSRQSIVVLEWRGRLPPARPLPQGALIRRMRIEDLPAVVSVDNRAFDPLWQNSLETIRLAFEQSALSTVAEIGDQIVGYQISTMTTFSGHLARLAVLPQFQRQNIAYGLVLDLLAYFHHKRAWRVTVNTQSDNHGSLSLYDKMGFTRTGDEFPVFEYPLD